MRYQVENGKLNIFGRLIDYGLVSITHFCREVYDRRCRLDDSIRKEWETRGKPEDLSWITCFENDERMRMINQPVSA